MKITRQQTRNSLGGGVACVQAIGMNSLRALEERV